MTQVKVTRAFCLAGLRQEVGAVVEVSESLAAELVATGKASRDAAPVSVGEAPKRKAKKEETNEPV